MSGVLGVLDQYRQCSFRGVPFAVIGSGGRAGRKTAVHDYPFLDTPWVEDLGRAGRGVRVLTCGQDLALLRGAVAGQWKALEEARGN